MTNNNPYPRGVALTRSPLGGYSVEWNGKFIGWIHASVGDMWNAYVASATHLNPGTSLGRFTQSEAVQRIAMAAGCSGRAGGAV
jgi:hypothetical protein